MREVACEGTAWEVACDAGGGMRRDGVGGGIRDWHVEIGTCDGTSPRRHVAERRLCCAGPGCVCGPPKICTCQPHGAAPPRVCRYAEFKKLNAEVVGVSVDSAHAHLAWCVRRDAPLSCARRRSTRLGTSAQCRCSVGAI